MSGVKHYIQQIKNGRLSEILGQLAWIYTFAKKYLVFIGLYTLLGMSGTVVTLISSLVSRDLVDIITGQQTGKLLATFATMIGITLGGSCITQLSGYISNKISIKIDNEIKSRMFDEILSTDWESLTRYHSGDLLIRWNGDASVISTGILTVIPSFINYLFRFVSALIMVLHYDASFAVFALVSIPVSVYTSRTSLKKLQQSNMNSMNIGSKMSAFNNETFSNIQAVKAFDMLPLYSRRLRELQKQYSDARLKYQRVSIINSFILTIVSLIVSYSAHGWGIYKVWKGDITYGTMTMFLALSASLSGTVDNMIGFVPTTINLANCAKRLMGILNLPKEDYSQKEEVAAFFEANKESGVGISIRNVSYAYATGTEVFENVSFDAHPHEVIALVGPSGEGKTTMLRVLLSIIRPQTGGGYICTGDTTPENASSFMELTASTRQLFAYVPQGNTMFSGTIADNMRNVKEDATDEEIIEALKIACAWDFVEKLPDGINSEIKERGGGFSEGQAQRLSIARAVLRRSPILLLDEATSALDMVTERKVLQNIMEDKYPRTTIVTTHRPSVLNICRRVYSIHDKQCTLLNSTQIEEMIKGY